MAERRWGKFRSIEDSPFLQSQTAEMFHTRHTRIPICVMWSVPFPGAPGSDNPKWFIRGVEEFAEFKLDLPNMCRLEAIKILEENLERVLNENV